MLTPNALWNIGISFLHCTFSTNVLHKLLSISKNKTKHHLVTLTISTKQVEAKPNFDSENMAQHNPNPEVDKLIKQANDQSNKVVTETHQKLTEVWTTTFREIANKSPANTKEGIERTLEQVKKNNEKALNDAAATINKNINGIKDIK